MAHGGQPGADGGSDGHKGVHHPVRKTARRYSTPTLARVGDTLRRVEEMRSQWSIDASSGAREAMVCQRMTGSWHG